ncbi:MAG TPA: IPT/TIG domain-containing protein [Longimicrobiales bacterium]|nr:IPT/TIG domain-containing protein [Longimicrobiales bacterium]
MHRIVSLLGLSALVAAGCRASPAAPSEPSYRVVVYGDSTVFTTANARSEDLHVAVLNAATGAPVSGVGVTWRVVSGSAGLGRVQSVSDEAGLASTWLPGAAEGAYRVEASTPRLQGRPAVLTVRVVPPPQVAGVSPASISAGGEVTVNGASFSDVLQENAVYFDGVRGRVLSGSTTELRVRVPTCLPSREARISVGLGAVMTAGPPVAVHGTGGTAVDLAPGGVRTIDHPDDLSCLRLPGGDASAWVLVVHSTADGARPPSQFQLQGLAPHPVTTTAIAPATPTSSFESAWEASLRVRERGLGAALAPPGEGLAASTPLPSVGTQRQFNVYEGNQQFSRVTASARVVGIRGVVYVDDEAAAEFTDDDLQYFANVFDDPIHDSLVGVFGEPSDLDGNGRIIILFTPRVNALTPRGSSSFISGFFYGCDLVGSDRCSGTNRGEIFYALVPDPTGRWSDARSRTTVRAAVPPVLAHEFQHMIHFARRGFSSDALWLSEGLAHTAEELVADALDARGETSLAQSFRSPNYGRAQQYLTNPPGVSLLGEDLPGSIAQRGAAWLMVRHLRGHHGGTGLLQRLTSSTRTSVANVVHETGRPWRDLASDFGVALWAADAPDLEGPLDARYTFPGFNLRQALSTVPGAYPLQVSQLSWQDVLATGAVGAGSHRYFRVSTPSSGDVPTVTWMLSGLRGAPLDASAGLAFSLVRVR